MEVLTVKIDATEAMAAIKKALEPGAILLSAEAVEKLDRMTDISADDLIAFGGILGTGDEVKA
jgi:ribosome biogenesis SPOUT family RNA methylase Rps3